MTTKKLNLSELRKIIKEELSEAKPTHFDGIRIPDAADLSNKAIELSKQAIKAHEEAIIACKQASRDAAKQSDTEEASRLLSLSYMHEKAAEEIRDRLTVFDIER